MDERRSGSPPRILFSQHLAAVFDPLTHRSQLHLVGQSLYDVNKAIMMLANREKGAVEQFVYATSSLKGLHFTELASLVRHLMAELTASFLILNRPKGL